MIKHKRETGAITPTLYDDYDTLFKHMIGYDLEKAIKLCKALLVQEKDEMPVSHVKLFNFNLGCAYLLNENYEEAKNKFWHCIEADPLGNLKSYAYNNLALACWWHKNPLETRRDIRQEPEKLKKIDQDFEQTRGLFYKSITYSQKVSAELNADRQLGLMEILDPNNTRLHDHVSFNDAASIFPISNLSEYFMANDPLNKIQILFWLSKGLALSKKVENEEAFDRTYVQESLLTQNIEALERVLPDLILKNRSCQKFANESYYAKILALILADKNKQKSEEYFQRSQTIDRVLPNWSQKLRYLAMNEIDLLK